MSTLTAALVVSGCCLVIKGCFIASLAENRFYGLKSRHLSMNWIKSGSFAGTAFSMLRDSGMRRMPNSGCSIRKGE